MKKFLFIWVKEYEHNRVNFYLTLISGLQYGKNLIQISCQDFMRT